MLPDQLLNQFPDRLLSLFLAPRFRPLRDPPLNKLPGPRFHPSLAPRFRQSPDRQLNQFLNRRCDHRPHLAIRVLAVANHQHKVSQAVRQLVSHKLSVAAPIMDSMSQ